tara:strand:+ start:837 stop:1331 length:495 start_codon:yes stop_codon:yes gene_type:complete
MANTTNYTWAKPTVGGSEDTWGTELNTVIDGVDTELFRVEGLIPVVTGYAPLAGATFTGNVTAPFFIGELTGNSATSTRLKTARSFTLQGVITGTQTFNGTGDCVLTTAIADATLSIAKTSGLQAALDAKEPTLTSAQKLNITYGTAAVGGSLAEGDIYLQHEA